MTRTRPDLLNVTLPPVPLPDIVTPALVKLDELVDLERPSELIQAVAKLEVKDLALILGLAVGRLQNVGYILRGKL